MKVGTDGVLLGAWASVAEPCRRILDIGTGTGVVALMLAERTEEWGATVTGIDIDAQSAAEAADNFSLSPWSDRLAAVCCPVQEFSDVPFDLIVSNPPFFVDSLLPPKASRSAARHNVSLSFEELLHASARLLAPEGRLAVVLPCTSALDFIAVAAREELFVLRRTDVRSVEGEVPKRALLEFSARPCATVRSELSVCDARREYTAEYKALTGQFYLNF